MSYIRLAEERRYFPGESSLYVYPVAGEGRNEIKFQGDLNGTISSEDFWELVLRALERTDLNEDPLWDAEAAVLAYQNREHETVEDLREPEEND